MHRVGAKRQAEGHQGPAPARQPVTALGHAPGHADCERGHHRHQEARRRAIASPPHPPRQHRRHDGGGHQRPGPHLAQAGAPDPGDQPPGGEQEHRRVGKQAERAVQQQPQCGAQRARAQPRGQAAVDRERRRLTEHALVPAGPHQRRHGRDPGEGPARRPAQPCQPDDPERGRRRDQLHVQPRQGRRQQRRGHGRAVPARPQRQKPERQRQGQGRGDLGVDVEGEERDRRPESGGPGHQRRLGVPGQRPRHSPHLDGERRGEQRQQHHAGRAPTQRVDRRQQQRQAGTVRGERPPVGPGRAVVRPQRPRVVGEEVLARVVVHQVQVALVPEALGHQQVVGLVSRGLEPLGVVESRAAVEQRRHAEEVNRPDRGRPQPASPGERDPGREGQQRRAQRAPEHSQGR